MDGMTWMASAMRGAQTQLETAANNLANVASDGFQRVRTRLELTDHGLISRADAVATQGGIRETGRALDLALVGPGTFRVGNRATRDGSFLLDRGGFITDRNGRRLHGMDGPIRALGPVAIGTDGSVRDAGRLVGRIPLPAGTTLRSGALESSGVDAIRETLSILTAQRAFETAQKTLTAIDQTRDKAVNDVVRLK